VTQFCKFEHANARFRKTEAGRWSGRHRFANSSTCMLESAKRRVVGSWTRPGRLDVANSRGIGVSERHRFANSSTEVLESAKRRVLGG